VFIFDTDILQRLESDDIRVNALYRETGQIHAALRTYGSSLKIMYGKPSECFSRLLLLYRVGAVYANTDYEPYALKRDDEISRMLDKKGVRFIRVKDHVIYEKNEIVREEGKPYRVYTPYMRKWK